MTLALGIDIGGTKISGALVRNGEIVKKVELAFERERIIRSEEHTSELQSH